MGTTGKFENSKIRKVETATKSTWLGVRGVLMAAFTVWSVGCTSHFVNPWRDELGPGTEGVAAPTMTTPSVDAARAATARPSNLQRSFAPDTLESVDGAVTHGPLWFEDRHESTSYDDGQFAWTGMDYWYLFYGPGRWMANGILFPVSVAAMPPWVLMESDGSPGCRAFGERHDAARRTEPGADVSVTE